MRVSSPVDRSPSSLQVVPAVHVTTPLTRTASKSAVHAPRPACVLVAVSQTRSLHLPSRARRFGRPRSAFLLPMVSNCRHGPPRELEAFQFGAVAVDGRFRRRRRCRCDRILVAVLGGLAVFCVARLATWSRSALDLPLLRPLYLGGSAADGQ